MIEGPFTANGIAEDHHFCYLDFVSLLQMKGGNAAFLTDLEMGDASKMILWFAILLDAIVIAAADSVVHGNICPALGNELLINWFIFPLSILSFHYDGNVRGSSDQLECLQLLFQITACSSINELCFCYNITRIVLKIYKLKMQKFLCFSFFILDIVIKSYMVTCYR